MKGLGGLAVTNKGAGVVPGADGRDMALRAATPLHMWMVSLCPTPRAAARRAGAKAGPKAAAGRAGTGAAGTAGAAGAADTAADTAGRAATVIVITEKGTRCHERKWCRAIRRVQRGRRGRDGLPRENLRWTCGTIFSFRQIPRMGLRELSTY